MAIKWDLVRAGDELWQKRRQQAGNTTMRRDAVFGVRIIDIDHGGGWATVSWNGNRPERWSRRRVETLSRRRPAERTDL